jgi:hypothetical protein
MANRQQIEVNFRKLILGSQNHSKIQRAFNPSTIYPRKSSTMLDSIKQRIKRLLNPSKFKRRVSTQDNPRSSVSTPLIPPQSQEDNNPTLNGDAEIEIIDLYVALTIARGGREDIRAIRVEGQVPEGVVVGREFVIASKSRWESFDKGRLVKEEEVTRHETI